MVTIVIKCDRWVGEAEGRRLREGGVALRPGGAAVLHQGLGRE